MRARPTLDATVDYAVGRRMPDTAMLEWKFSAAVLLPISRPRRDGAPWLGGAALSGNRTRVLETDE